MYRNTGSHAMNVGKYITQSKKRMLLMGLLLLLSGVLIVQCGGGGGGGGADTKDDGNSASARYDVTFVLSDSGAERVASATVHVGASAAVAATTNADGEAKVEVRKSETIQFRKSGQVPLTVTGEHWDDFDEDEFSLWFTELNDGTGTIAGTVSGNTTGDDALVRTLLASWYSSRGVQGLTSPSDPEAFGPLAVHAGSNSVFAFASQRGVSASNAFFGMATGLNVSDGESVTDIDIPVQYGGKTFNVVLSGEFSNASAGYQILVPGAGLVDWMTPTGVASGTITVTVPTNTGNLAEAATYLSAFDSETASRNAKNRFASKRFNSRSELLDAATTQTIELLNHGMGNVEPSDGSTNVSLTPAISWTVETDEHAGVILYVFENGGGFRKLIWRGWAHAGANEIQVPDGILGVNTTYDLWLWTDIWEPVGHSPDGAVTSFGNSGIRNIFFSTGPTVTPF